MINAPRPSENPPTIEKRTEDIKKYTISCSPILEPSELIYGSISFNTHINLIITNVKTRQGKNIEFRLAGGPIGGKFTEYLVSFIVNTTLGNTLKVPVNVRVYV